MTPALSSPNESWRLFALIPTLEGVEGPESDALLEQIDARAPDRVAHILERRGARAG